MTPSNAIVMPKGTLLFAEGDAGATAYIIKQGRIEIFLARESGEIQLVTRGPGEIVGEMALIDGGWRSASARLLEECELTLINADQFARRLAKSDPALRMCLDVVIERYRQTVAMLDAPSERVEADEAPPVSVDRHVAAALEALSLEGELRRAIGRGELELHFQPIVHLSDRRLVGFEALIRWNHPQRGLLSPGLFIPVAEASGLIVEITAWCIGEIGRLFPAMRSLAEANPDADDDLFMSVNISGLDLTEATFMHAMDTMLRHTGLPPEAIKLEITESVLMEEPLKAAAVLKACRERGHRIAIDDFGTGYSSLSHLSVLPITAIKVDQSFVRAMNADATSRRIVAMVLRLAAELEIPVIAEGIEREDQAAQLVDLRCALGQGYLFGKPQSFAATLEQILSWRTVAGHQEQLHLFARSGNLRPALLVAA